MEKVIVALRNSGADEQWCTTVRTGVAQQLLELGFPGVAVNVRDDAVRESLMTLTTLDPPVVGFVSLWTQQYYGDQVAAALGVLDSVTASLAAYLVTESVPLPPPVTGPGERTEGFANVALLRRPADLDSETWLRRWHLDHTPVAIETQSTFGYVQNTVVRPLTPDARRDRRGAVPAGGDARPARLLRCERRRRTERPDDAHGGEHLGVRRQRRRGHGADQPVRVPGAVRRLVRLPLCW